jgi:uncharacterized membrane protein YjgN (DUF898 family)
MIAPPATAPAAQSGRFACAGGRACFHGDATAYWRLVTRGAVLLMFTLGIYRFWLTTDIRRFLWSSTELAGETFEYIGTAREILLGFLIAIALLIPLYSGFFLLALSLGPLGMASNGFALVILTVLGQYAVYRARRYRLSRTVYRGLRFHQTGSAWHYAVCAVFWWTLVILTLGLAYPLAQSRLERFKMGHTYFGSLQGSFQGSATTLLLRGALLWALAVGPFAAGVVAGALGVDWSAMAADGDDALNSLEASGLDRALVYGGLAAIWLVLVAAIVYPIFQAMVLRWWVSGLSFGNVTVSSRLRTSRVLGVYARFLWYAFLFTLVAGMVLVLGSLAIDAAGGEPDSLLREIVVTVTLLVAYVAFALGYSAIYQATVRLGLWRCVVESLDIGNAATLDHVLAAGDSASPIGEGLADALNVGGG